jgi:hypothetical protein
LRNPWWRASAGAAREVGPDSGELGREAKKLAAVGPFRMGQNRCRPLESPDHLPAVDGPMAKSQTRDRVTWLAVQEGARFLPGDRRRALSRWLDGSVGG